MGLPVPPRWCPDEQTPPSRKVVVWDAAPPDRLRWQPGRITRSAASAAAAAIPAAVSGCLRGRFWALVTGPISKEGFHRAGITVPGHTEWLASLTRTRRFAMMLMDHRLRVALVTRHLPLAAVPAAVTRKAVGEAIALTSDALPWLGARRRRIGVCGLNPHAGEGGDLGREEIEVIAPAIRAARRKGIDALGPLPADTAFHQALHGAYDAVIAMYHDQGLAPLKMLAFDRGINVTLGLPMVRTSPDHGTAFDIAGQGQADPSSMVEALRLALSLARKPNPWRK